MAPAANARHLGPPQEDPLNTEICIHPLRGAALVRDYLSGEGGARSFYTGAPFVPAAYARKLDEVRRRFGREEREAAARALRPTSARARERLARWVEEGGAVVTTGQQAGFLTGPLYTVYKALTVSRLARALEAELGVIVLPIFWTASEDHDWPEANHTFLLDERDRLLRLELPAADLRPLPMSERRLREDVIPILDDAAQILSDMGLGDDDLRRIREAYDPGQTVAEAFTGVLSDLLSPFDLLLTDAADPHLKQASAPVLQHALREAERLEEALGRRGADLVAAGYHAQVAVPDGATTLFYHQDGVRERLDRAPSGFLPHGSGEVRTVDELLRELEATPGRFSPNALLRPVVESAVFPTLAYVGGPGEIAYFAQVNALFGEFGILPPVVHPRFSATLVEPSARRLLGRLGLELEELSRPRHEIETLLARRSVPAGARNALDRLARSLTEGYRDLIDEAERIDPGLRGALGALRNETLARLAESETRIVRGVKAREATLLGQLDRLLAQLRPDGQPQERVLNVFPLIARSGRGLLARLHDAAAVSWREVELAEGGAVSDPPR